MLAEMLLLLIQDGDQVAEGDAEQDQHLELWGCSILNHTEQLLKAFKPTIESQTVEERP